MRAVLRWVAEELGTTTYVNLMAQYYPAGRVSAGEYGEINRHLSREEYLHAVEAAWELELRLDERSVGAGLSSLA